MIGCLLAPFRLIGVAVIILAVAGGWLYRDRIGAEVRQLAGHEATAAGGSPSAGALETARSKVTALARAGSDSVVLDAAEAASLLAAGLDPAVRGRLDSLSVQLGTGRVAISGVVATGRLPADLIGPLTIVLRDRERITAGGALRMTAPGQARWAIDQFELRGFPFPRDVVPGIVERALGPEADGAIAIRVPASVSAIRIEPQRVILYRDARP